MPWNDLTRELAELQGRFKAEESSAATMMVAPLGQFVVVRADGIKATKRHLKDQIHNDKFFQAVRDATATCMTMWRDHAKVEDRPYLLGAFAVSDEVSFIVGPGDNYYGRRLWKMASTLGGTLSGAATARFDRKIKDRPLVVAFDARPVLVPDKAALRDYLWCRALIGLRNALNRVLRLSDTATASELYRAATTRDDFEWMASKIGELGLEPQLKLASKSFSATCWDGAQRPTHVDVQVSSGDRDEFLWSIEPLGLGR